MDCRLISGSLPSDRTRWAGLLLLLGMSLAQPAWARDAGGIELRPEVTSDVPVQLGVALVAEFPGRLRLDTGLGFAPKGYVHLINAVSVELSPQYTQASADLVEAALQNSLVWRSHVGWRPFRGHGGWLALGYTLVALGGGASAADLIAGLTGVTIPASETQERPRPGGAAAPRTLTVSAQSRLHMLDIALGWEWLLWRELTLRTGIGWSWTFASWTDLEPDFQVRLPENQSTIDRLEADGEAYLNDQYTSYVHPPWITLALGWRF